MSAITVVVVIVMLIAIGGTVMAVPAFSVGCPSDDGDDGGAELHAVLGELILDSWRYLVEVFACDKSTSLESPQSIG